MIPYDSEDQKELAQFCETNKGDIKAGCFPFEYNDNLEGISSYSYILYQHMKVICFSFPLV